MKFAFGGIKGINPRASSRLCATAELGGGIITLMLALGHQK